MKRMITGVFNKQSNTYTMHSPVFPYTSKVYANFKTVDDMKKQYRKDFDLQGKRLDWIILGLPLEEVQGSV